ncbi:MAG: DUF3667 domain-containing protein [Sphingobacteriaceae bacterium]|nr:MAG: DUF3667 domain-containing protein [Sphingobacteriaceae bacterium]
MKKHYRKEKNCLNCGTILDGKYCHNCGQENLQIKESFGHMMTHAVSDYFHFDHQFFHTLGPLLFKPGKLTNEYMAGKRVQFLHPVKMYIFISIVYFLVAFQGSHEVVQTNNTTKVSRTEAEQAIKVTNSSYLSKEEKLKIANTIKRSIRPGKKEEQLSPEEEDDNFENAFLQIFTDKANKVHYKSYDEYLNKQKKLPAKQQDNFWDSYIIKKYITWQNDGVNSKKLFIHAIQQNIPKLMFILLPLFALILKITFWRNDKFYVDHLIFSFHFHCFIFLFLTIIKLTEIAIPESWEMGSWLNLLSFIIITWYIYRSLKTVYNRSRLRTIVKMMGMSFAYLFMFCISITIVAFITAFTAV